MIQLKVYKTKGDDSTALFLDLYDTEPIKLTLSIEDITQADATSVFSKTFRVPATRHNNDFFENAYEVDGIDFDVTLKNYAEILVDGAEFREGHVRLQRIFRNQDLDRIDYELLFLGETRDFSSTIAEKTLCQITMTDFDWVGLPQNYTNAADFTGPFTYANISQSWLAHPETPGNMGAGYADGDILMPLIDHGNTYTDAQGSGSDGDPDQGRIALGPNGTGSRSFCHPVNSLSLTRMKPMIRAKRVLDQIFQDVGYTYSSTFLNSDLFYQMYISAFGNNEQIGMEIDQVTGTNFESNNPTNGENDVEAFMYNDNVITNIAGNYTVGNSNVSGSGNGSYFTAPADAAIGGNFYVMSASAQMQCEVEQSNGPNINVPTFLRLCVVNTPGGNILHTLATGNNASQMSTSSLNWDSRNGGYQPIAGDVIQVYCDTSSGFVDYSQVDNTFWNCTAAPGDYYSPLDLDCEHKQIDYVKDILTMFRLVMQPDNKRPNNFIIEPWQEFIGSGTTYDWSHKLVEDMDSVLEPLFNTQSATIEFSKAEDEDFINQFHQDNNKHAYGYLQFNSANELLKGTRKIEVKGIAPTPIDQIAAFPGQAVIPQWVIPQIVEHNDDTAANEHVPIKPKTRFLFYNGLETIPAAFNTVWYINNDSGTATSKDKWPLVSPYENWPVQQTSLNLNFSNDTRYYISPSPGTGYFDQGSTLFDAYWSRYISSLYNKSSRRLTAKFVLNNVDLQDLTFDDVIFVNGKYYRPEKIIDAQVGAETVVTCQLITLNDQRPVWLEEPLTGFSVVASNTSCVGQEGEIQITTNGTPAFTWELDASGATGTVNPTGSAPFTFTISAPVGIDTLTVTDSLGRVATVQVDVPASTALPVSSTSTSIQPTDCVSPCNGQITVTPTGGAGAPYTVTWDDGGSGAARTGLCPGPYQYYVEDVNGCQSDVFEVDLTCQTAQYVYQLREHLNNCTQSSSAIYIMSSAIQLPINQTLTLNERNGCYYIQSTSTDQPQYTPDALSTDCASCGGGGAPLSYEVETCGTGAATHYASRTGTPLQPGLVVELSNDQGCYIVIGDSSVAPDNDVQAIYKQCNDCTQSPTVFFYKFRSCDGLFDAAIQSPVQLSLGSTIDITPGPGCGDVYANTSGPGVHTWTGQLLYEDCDACNGIAPPPAQTCHTIENTGLGTAQGTYTFNSLGYGWTASSGTTISICAEVGSVVITSGQATITNTTKACTSPKACRLAPSLCQSYLISNDGGSNPAGYSYTSCEGQSQAGFLDLGQSVTVCSLTLPNVASGMTISFGITTC